MTGHTKAMTTSRSKPALLLAAGGIAIALSGCVDSPSQRLDYANDYRQRHPITLQEGERTVEVFIGRNRGGLSPVQRADVLAFAQIWKREANSGIIVDIPQGGPTDRAAADTMREIHSIFAASGVPRNAVVVRPYRPQTAALTSIKLNYSKLMADAGPCGQWPQDLGVSTGSNYTENKPYWNFGCATQRNLANMVDNPADLVQPRGDGPAYNARRTVVMDKYRKGDIPSGQYPSDGGHGYDTGKISDIGK
jgi:pilus assembly protein CpaD